MTDNAVPLALRMMREVKGPDYQPPKGSLAGAMIYAAGPIDSPELRRIIALPKRTEGAPDLTDEFRHTARCARGCALCRPRKPHLACFDGCPLCAAGEAHLWPLQSEALYWAQIADGLIGALAVSAGKTLLTLLLPMAMPSQRMVLLVPPQLRDQLKKMLAMYRAHWRIPEVVFGRGPPFDGIRVFGYSEISVASGADALELADPDLVVLDEAHQIRNKGSVRARRLARLMRSRPGRRLVALSGSMTTKSVTDYGHLMEMALRKNSALPRPWPELDDWSRVLDAGVQEDRRLPPGALVLLGSKSDSIDDVRAAYRERLVSTPGVVASGANVLGMSLVIQCLRPKLSKEVARALAELERTWCRPDGEEIESPLMMAAVTRQLAYGFYYVWDWPNGVVDQQWLESRALWHKEMREYLKSTNRPGMDSPGLLALAASSGRWASQHWAGWAAVKDRPEPPVRTDWIDRAFAVDLVRKWMSEGPGIVWYEHKAIGLEVSRALRLAQFEGGSDAALLAATPENTPHPVCSIRAHGTGKNLQAWSRGLILGAPANGTTYEQLLGRMHRDGQLADEVVFTLPLHHASIEAALDTALTHAQYKEDTLEGRQKLLYAEIVR